MKQWKHMMQELRMFLLLWSTQSFSALGSAMTNFALVIWSYQQTGSALSTALLSICSYAPYVIFSILSGTLSDRFDKRKTMLVADTFAALCTITVLLLLKTNQLQLWHLYVLNAFNGLMNTIQQPASDVAITLLVPDTYYQKVSGLRSLSNSLVTVLTPVFATALLSFTSIEAVIAFDLITFSIAFLSLACFIKIPALPASMLRKTESVLAQCKSGLHYVKEHRGILDLIFFLAAINFIASMYEAALPAMVLSKNGGDEIGLGIINTWVGIASLTGSILVSCLPAPKSRVRVICNTLLFSMSTENFLLALGNGVGIWSLGAFLGWIGIPLMNANMDVLFRQQIPVELQGRVYSIRNSFQFFTIPLGYLAGGFLVDVVLEPWMSANDSLAMLFGSGKGSGAAFLFFILGFAGMLVCLLFRRSKAIWRLEES